jgi:acyl transferase domain-containing protein
MSGDSSTTITATDVAIVGMAAVFPGATDAATYWQNIIDGVDAITDVPPGRIDPVYYDPTAWENPSADRFYTWRGGFVDTRTQFFDPARFGVMPLAVHTAEPDQLIALQIAARALDDAGGLDRVPDRERVGVVLGRGGYIGPGMHRENQRIQTSRQLTTVLADLLPEIGSDRIEQVRGAFLAALGPELRQASIGIVPNLAASRIANRLDLHGPAYTVDAACASSLVAVDHAVRELASGRSDLMLAGGVHHAHDVVLWSLFCQLRALSRSSCIRPFDRRADGVLVGEGTGIVVLKRLTDAQRGGDRVYAVIRGSGVASDGRAASLMAPHPDGQILAMSRAWKAAGLDPTRPGAIGLIEAHGTATPVGDTAEITSLRTVLGDDPRSGPIGLGSVKSMIGHAMPAAGAAGLIKAAFALYHRVLPPTLHAEQGHELLEGSRLQLIGAARPWEVDNPAERPR